MNRFIEVLSTVLPVALTLVIGMICRARGVIRREGIDALKHVAVNIALPAVLLSAFATTQYTLMDVAVPLIMFAVCVAAWALGGLGKRLLKLPSRFVPFLTTGFEAGMLGYALFSMLYGADRVAEFARLDLGQVLFVFTLYRILLDMSGSEKPTAAELARGLCTSPIIIAIVAGVLLGATGLYRSMQSAGIAGAFDACTDFISAPVSALILLCVGYDLVPGSIPWRATASAVVLRVGIMLVLRCAVGLLLRAFWPAVDLSRALNVMFILPPPFVLPVFADEPEEQVYLSSALSASTVLTIAAFAVLAAAG